MKKMKRRLVVYGGMFFAAIVVYYSTWLYGACSFLMQGGHSSFEGMNISLPIPWHSEPLSNENHSLLWVHPRNNIYDPFDDSISVEAPFWQNSSQIDLPLWHKLYGSSNTGVFAQHLEPLGFTCGTLRQHPVSKQVTIGCMYLKTGRTFTYQGSTMEMEGASRIIGETAR